MTAPPAQPTPHPDAISEPYWAGLRRGALLLQRCTACGTFRHYPRLVCDRCYATAVEWVEACGRGEIFSWTVAHHPFHPGFKDELPYILVVVTLAEGVRAMGRLHDPAATRLRLGMAVRFSPHVRADGLVLPGFEIAA